MRIIITANWREYDGSGDDARLFAKKESKSFEDSCSLRAVAKWVHGATRLAADGTVDATMTPDGDGFDYVLNYKEPITPDVQSLIDAMAQPPIDKGTKTA